MNLKYKYLISSSLLLILVLMIINNINFTVSEKISLKCHYMAYSCGDCYNQYQVEKIVSVTDNYDFLLGKEIAISFENENIAKELDKKTQKCVICYDFYFDGYVKKTIYQNIFFQVSDIKIKLRENCCED